MKLQNGVLVGGVGEGVVVVVSPIVHPVAKVVGRQVSLLDAGGLPVVTKHECQIPNQVKNTKCE